MHVVGAPRFETSRGVACSDLEPHNEVLWTPQTEAPNDRRLFPLIARQSAIRRLGSRGRYADADGVLASERFGVEACSEFK